MYTEDFILRMINQAMAVLLQVLGFKRAGQRQEALQAIDQALEMLLGLRASLLRQLDEAKILQMLTAQGELDIDRLALLADIYYEEGEIQAAEGKADESRQAYNRALRFYLEAALDPRSGGLPGMAPDKLARMAALASQIEAARLPLETRLALLDFYERLVDLPEARLAEAGITAAQVKQEYASLLRLPDMK